MVEGITASSKVPQWMQFIEYNSSLSDDIGFDPKMYNPGRPDWIQGYRDNWEKYLESRKRRANMLLSAKPGPAMNGEIKGLLFVRDNSVEYAIYRCEYPSDSTGSIAVVRDGSLIVADEQTQEMDFKVLTKCFSAQEHDAILEKLKSSAHGISRVTDPYKWQVQ